MKLKKKKFSLFRHLITIKMSFFDKIEILIVLGISIFEYVVKKIIFRKDDIKLYNLIEKWLPGKVFCVKFSKFNLYLTLDEIVQDLANPSREAYIPFKQYVKKGYVVCDVGAHIGTHTLKLANLVGPSGRVIAIEPNIHNFGLLCLNIFTNNFSNTVTPIPAALAPKSGRSKLYTSGRSMYYSLVRESNDFEIVNTISFKILFEQTGIDRIDFAKIDIEGAEEKLLLSEHQAFIDKRIQVMFVDWHEGVDYDRIIKHLKKFGYHYNRIEGGALFYLP
jgi:FkbM family methyltransferase